jgi:hypothetical protein
MGRTMPKEYYSSFMSPYKRNPIENKDSIYMIDCEPQLLFLNAVISRCSWDFLHQKYWADKIMDKLQKKLDKIHVRYCIVPMFGCGFILALLADLTNGAKYKHCQYLGDIIT